MQESVNAFRATTEVCNGIKDLKIANDLYTISASVTNSSNNIEVQVARLRQKDLAT